MLGLIESAGFVRRGPHRTPVDNKPTLDRKAAQAVADR
jgi:hypothetical protein